MIRKFGLYSPGSAAGLLSIFGPGSPLDQDKPAKNTVEKYFTHDPTETGWDRLHLMFAVDEYGSISPEMTSVSQSGMMGLLTGALIGGMLHSKTAYINFLEKNQATSFNNHLEAKRTLQDKVTLGFGRGAFQWGWRMGLFTSSYTLITTGISIYRGKSGIVEYAVAGGLTGAAYKCNLGVRGIAIGTLVGTVLGSIAGGVSLTILRLTGTTMEEVRGWQYKVSMFRKNAPLRDKSKLNEDARLPPLLELHDMVLAERLSQESQPTPSATPTSS